MGKPLPEWIGEAKKKMAIMGMNQKELAESIGLSYSYIRMLMCGNMEHEPAKQAICKYLDIKDG